MSAAPLPALVHAFLPEFARRFAAIVAGLAALIARRLPANPRLALLVVPLWSRLARLARRAERLIALLAAGRLPCSRPRRAHRGGPRARCLLPHGRHWLIRALGHEAAAYATQLEALLAEPATATLLAQVPAARRLVLPLGRLLALDSCQPRPHPRAPRAARPRPPVFRPTSPTPSAHWPWLRPAVRKRA